MDNLSLLEVRRLLAAASAARGQRDAPGGAGGADVGDAERHLDALFGTGHMLAVYATLAPGQPNHHVVAPWGASGRTA